MGEDESVLTASLPLKNLTGDDKTAMASINYDTLANQATSILEQNHKDAPKAQKPDLCKLISVHDFEDVARETFPAKAFAFYSSAATDLVTHQANLQVNRRLLLRPRVLRDVSKVKMQRRILGYESSAPFFFSPAAMAKLAHPEGELAFARACGNENVIPIVSDQYPQYV